MTRPRLDPAFLGAPLAHRALHDRAARRPENSLAAIHAAVQAGYGIEIDLQQSADGVAMVFHDDDTGRLTGHAGPVRAQTVAELKSRGLLDSDAPMPTLGEVLDVVAGRAPLLIELKDQTGCFGATDGALEMATASALTGYHGPVALMSFNPFAVGRLAELAPQIPRGLTTYGFPAHDMPRPLSAAEESHRQWLANIEGYDDMGASFISHHWRELDNTRVHDLRERGADVLCWTVRSREEERIARQVAQNVTFEGYAAVHADPE